MESFEETIGKKLKINCENTSQNSNNLKLFLSSEKTNVDLE